MMVISKLKCHGLSVRESRQRKSPLTIISQRLKTERDSFLRISKNVMSLSGDLQRVLKVAFPATEEDPRQMSKFVTVNPRTN